MARQPQRLQIERLSVRRPRRADAEAVVEILSHPAVVQHNPSDLLTDLRDGERLLGRWLDHWERHGFGNATVVELDSGRVVGNCGVRWMTIGGERVLNLMYRFHPSSWGRGYATEATGALLAWTRQELPDETIVARIRPANLASQRVAMKTGLHRDPVFDDEGEDGLDWAFTRRTHQS